MPLLPGAREALAAGALTGGAARNDRYLEPLVDWGRTTQDERALLVDPQTSGGLLVAVPPGELGRVSRTRRRRRADRRSAGAFSFW